MKVPNNHIAIETNGLKPGKSASEDISDLVVTALDTDAIWAAYREQDMRGHISLIGKANTANEEGEK